MAHKPKWPHCSSWKDTCMKYAVADRGQDLHGHCPVGRVCTGPLAAPAWRGILPSAPHPPVGAPGAHWWHAPFSALSSRLPSPKSIYEGNFGCGYLKERRASGLVFCENTASVYRALFVSPPGYFFFVVAWNASAVCSALEWCGMLPRAPAWRGFRVLTLCLFCKTWLCCDIGACVPCEMTKPGRGREAWDSQTATGP